MLAKSYNHHSAIYHLLVDKFRKHQKLGGGGRGGVGAQQAALAPILPPNLPVATRTERRSSITTGVGTCRVYLHGNQVDTMFSVGLLMKYQLLFSVNCF